MIEPGEISDRDRAIIDALASRTVTLLETEYPNSVRLDLRHPPDRPISPRALHPAFYGCYDWHSAVHSAWQVARAARACPDAPFVDAVVAVLDRLLTLGNISFELAWASERPNFEMPYGMAWLLTLDRELSEWSLSRSATWARAVEPLAEHAAEQFERYCRSLSVPVRGGLHNQTAFSLGLVWDASPHRPELRALISTTALYLYGRDTTIDARLEPSASDFLSSSWSTADLMRRVLPHDEFAAWFDRYASSSLLALSPVEVADPSDGQLAHWAGLNLSRAWMMRSVADSLPPRHESRPVMMAGANAHAESGLATAAHDDYMISHWVPSFAVYLLTGR